MSTYQSFRRSPSIASLLGGIFLFLSCLQALTATPASAQEGLPIDFQNQVPYMVLDPKDPQSVADWQAAMRRSGAVIQDGRVIGNDLLARYIQALYSYGIYIAIILSAVILMAGGLIWLSSGGNDSRISKAKTLITASLAGLTITLGSWVLLNTINPDLLKLQVLNPLPIKKKVLDIPGLVCEWRCQGLGERCEGNSGNSTLPASSPWYTANLEVCQRNKGNMPTSGCEGGKKYNCCCTVPPKAQDIPDQVSWEACMDENGKSKEEGAACKMGDVNGYCKLVRDPITGQYKDTACTPCLKIGEKCNKNVEDYECAGENGVCGQGSGGDCNSRGMGDNIIGGLSNIFSYLTASTITCNSNHKILIDPSNLSSIYVECRCK